MRRFPIYSNTSLIYALVLSFSAAVWAQSDKKPQTTISEERASESGMVEIDVSDIVGRPLHTVVEFVDSRGSLVRSVEFPSGIGETSLPRGRYEAHVSVAHMGALFLVEVKPIQVSGQEAAYLLVSLAEGSANLGLHEFDRDTDLVIDRVELAVGTDPDDPKSLPGHETLEWPSPVLSSDAGWYVGDLHTFTDASIGSESVSKLVSRAERSKLDFLAITDRNTLAHTRDRGYRSNSVVLIPAMEWGTDDSGYALILKPGTVPRPANGDLHAQTVLDRVVQQGGVFAPAHPCFPTSPWLRTIGYFNAVEVWCREWRMIPPLTPRALPEHLLATSESKLLYPVARAAQSSLHSANGQADFFWRTNLNAFRKAAAIGGSHSSSPKVDLGAPLTHVYASNKSLDAIIEGIRRGRTMVSRDRNSPRIEFAADALNDGKVETQIGGIVPIREENRFIVNVYGGLGKRLEILLNGQPIRTIDLPLDKFEYAFADAPEMFSNYLVRVTEKPQKEGFGLAEMLAMTSPIYAQEIVVVDERTGRSSWVRIESPQVPDNLPTPPLN